MHGASAPPDSQRIGDVPLAGEPLDSILESSFITAYSSDC